MNKHHKTNKAVHAAKRYLRKRDLAERYNTTIRNIEYKIKQGILPPPTMYLGRHPLFDEEAQDEHDRRAAMQRRRPTAPAPEAA